MKNEEALKRAIIRRDKAKAAKEKREERKSGTGGKRNWNIHNTSVISKPTFDQEIKLFKAITRQIARHELNDEQTKIFQMEKRAQLRRLAPLGIEGNEPAVKAYCKITSQEKATIIEAIMQQKVGANATTSSSSPSFKKPKNRTKQKAIKKRGSYL